MPAEDYARLMRHIAEADPKELGKIIRVWRKRNKITQASVAKAVGVTPQAVSQWERGETAPDLASLRKIAPMMEFIDQPEPIYLSSQPRMVRVVGYVGAGSEAHFYAVSQGDLDEVPAIEGSSPKTVAVELRGDSLGSTFDRWLVFYDDVRSPVTQDLYGRLCVVGLSDDRVLIKRIRAARNGFFDLLSEKEPPIQNVSIEWAARVKGMAPR